MQNIPQKKKTSNKVSATPGTKPSDVAYLAENSRIRDHRTVVWQALKGCTNYRPQTHSWTLLQSQALQQLLVNYPVFLIERDPLEDVGKVQFVSPKRTTHHKEGGAGGGHPDSGG